MKEKTKGKIKRTVSISLATFAVICGFGTCVNFILTDNYYEKGKEYQNYCENSICSQNTLINYFKQTNYFKNHIETQGKMLLEKFESGEISFEEYTEETSKFNKPEYIEQVLLTSNDEAIKSVYLVEQNNKQENKQLAKQENKKGDKHLIAFGANLVGAVGGGVASALTSKNKSKKQKDVENDDYL